MTAEPTARTLAFVPGIPEALFRLHDVDGSFPVTTARMHTGPWVRGPHGDPSPGVIGVLLDVLLGCPVIAGGPDGCWGVTTTMSAEFCAPIPAHTSYLTGTGEAMYLTETDGISRGSIHTAEGDLIVLGTQHTRFVPALPADRARPAVPDIADADKSVLDFLAAAGRTDDGGFTLELAAGPHVANPLGNLHGGIVLCLSEITASMATHDPARPLVPASISVAYLRPGPADGTVRFAAQVAHRGRTSAAVRIDCLRPEGKACAVATVTLRGRPCDDPNIAGG